MHIPRPGLQGVLRKVQPYLAVRNHALLIHISYELYYCGHANSIHTVH